MLRKQLFPDWAPKDVVDRWHEEYRQAQNRVRHFDEARHTQNISGAIARTSGEEQIRHETTLREYNEESKKDRLEYEADCYRIASLLRRLLTDERMRPVWQTFSKAGNCGHGAGVPHTTIFAACVIRAWMGPFGEEQWTPVFRTQWLRDVADLAEKLAKKLHDTGADEHLWRQYLSEKQTWELRQAAAAALRGEKGDRVQNDFGWHAGNVSDLLRKLGRHAEKYLKPSRLERPKDVHAPRAYFVRYLSEYCRETLGRQHSSLVGTVAAVALDDDMITDRQVRRIARPKNAPGR